MSDRSVISFITMLIFILCLFCLPGCIQNEQPMGKSAIAGSAAAGISAAVESEPAKTCPKDSLLVEYPKLVKGYPLNVYLKGNQAKTVALTFDDGPDGILTPQILDILKKKGVKATFFVCGRNVQAYPDVLQRIVEEGHEVGNHSWDHLDFCELSRQEVQWQVRHTAEEIQRHTRRHTSLFRPPYGSINQAVGQELANLQYFIVNWSIDSLDYLGLNKEKIIVRITEHTSAGDIILQHCSNHEALRNSLEALPFIIDILQSKGFQFLTITELLELPDK